MHLDEFIYIYAFTYFLRQVILALVLKNLYFGDVVEIKINFMKLCLINLFSFLVINFILNSKNIKQLVLYKGFLILILIRILFICSYLKNAYSRCYNDEISGKINALVLGNIILAIVDIFVSKYMYNYCYREFMSRLIHKVGVSFRRKKMNDTKQKIILGLLIYFTDIILNNLTYIMDTAQLTLLHCALLVYKICYIMLIYLSFVKKYDNLQLTSIIAISIHLCVVIVKTIFLYRNLPEFDRIEEIAYDILVNETNTLMFLVYTLYLTIHYYRYNNYQQNLFGR